LSEVQSSNIKIYRQKLTSQVMPQTPCKCKTTCSVLLAATALWRDWYWM